MSKTWNPSIVSLYAFLSSTVLLYFLYFLEMTNYIPRIPGKNLLVSIVFFIILFISFVYNIRKKINIQIAIFIFFIFYLVLYEIFHYNFYLLLDEQTSKIFLTMHISFIYGFFSYFLIGFFHIGFYKYKKLLYFSYVLITLFALTNMDLSTFVLRREDVNIELFGIYLFLGDTYAIVSIIVFFLLQKSRVHFLIFLISVLSLFVLNSRTSLYLYVVTVFFILFILNKKRIFVYLIFISILLYIFYMFNQQIVDTLINSRMLGFLFGNVDASFDARNEFSNIGMKGIINHWFEGDYGGEVIYFGKPGEHIHNYLALFRQYGILAYMLFLSLIATLVYDIFKWLIRRKEYQVDYNIYIALSVFLLLEAFFARGINFQQIFFVIGISLSFKKNLLRGNI